MEIILKSRLKDVLRRGDYALGVFCSINAPSIVEILAISGMDFVVIDMEHGPINIESIENMVRSAEIYGITALVRIPDYDEKLIGRLLDIGAHGVQVPMVHTAERAAEVVKAGKYAPLGLRGMSAGRGPKWGSISNYREVANKELTTVCMCESKEAVDNIEEIVKTPGLDIIFIGAVDLSQSLGCPGDVNNPIVEKHVQHVLKVCQNAGVYPGIVTTGVEEAQMRIKQGFRYVSVMNDMWLMRKTISKLVADTRNGLD